MGGPVRNDERGYGPCDVIPDGRAALGAAEPEPTTRRAARRFAPYRRGTVGSGAERAWAARRTGALAAPKPA